LSSHFLPSRGLCLTTCTRSGNSTLGRPTAAAGTTQLVRFVILVPQGGLARTAPSTRLCLTRSTGRALALLPATPGRLGPVTFPYRYNTNGTPVRWIGPVCTLQINVSIMPLGIGNVALESFINLGDIIQVGNAPDHLRRPLSANTV